MNQSDYIAGSGQSGTHVVTVTINPDPVIDFLSSCGDADIQAGIGSLMGIGSDDKIKAFRDGLTKAIAESLDQRT